MNTGAFNDFVKAISNQTKLPQNLPFGFSVARNITDKKILINTDHCWRADRRMHLIIAEVATSVWRSRIWRFFSIRSPQHPPPPQENKCSHPSPSCSFRIQELSTAIVSLEREICGKTEHLCREFLLVKWRSNQTIG